MQFDRWLLASLTVNLEITRLNFEIAAGQTKATRSCRSETDDISIRVDIWLDAKVKSGGLFLPGAIVYRAIEARTSSGNQNNVWQGEDAEPQAA